MFWKHKHKGYSGEILEKNWWIRTVDQQDGWSDREGLWKGYI